MPGGQDICKIKPPHYMPTLALGGGGWSVPHPGYFVPRKETQSSLYRRVGWLQEWSGWVWKIMPHQDLRLLSP